MFEGSFIARLFVVVQFISFLFLILSGPWIVEEWWLLISEILGILLGITAIWQMKTGNFNITPVPKPNGKLITHGVYSVIRHPMYLAQLLVVGSMVIELHSRLRVIVLMILVVNLLFKLNYEESRLVKHFKGYEKYKQTSWRLIPFIY